MDSKLKELQAGASGEITGYAQASAAYRDKLLSMGLTKGTAFTVVRVAPLGDPVEIRVRGFSLSLRKDEADALLVRRI
jgi:ferrous iron transport protein A